MADVCNNSILLSRWDREDNLLHPLESIMVSASQGQADMAEVERVFLPSGEVAVVVDRALVIVVEDTVVLVLIPVQPHV